ncbi:hypothetical protein Q3G72_031700 [Acer saccharum]|nr:hypothetical protein Q3G72_031700 [Acer saccharum]
MQWKQGNLDIFFDHFLHPIDGDFDDRDGDGFTDTDFIIPKAIDPKDLSLRNARLTEKMAERTEQDKQRVGGDQQNAMVHTLEYLWRKGLKTIIGAMVVATPSILKQTLEILSTDRAAFHLK